MLLLFGGGDVPYIFRDLFLGTIAAGSIDGTSSSDGKALRDVVDTGSNMSLSNGVVIAAGSGNTGDPGIHYTNHDDSKITISDGDALIFDFIPTSGAGDLVWGVDDDLIAGPPSANPRFYITSTTVATYTPVASYSFLQAPNETRLILVLISTPATTYLGYLSDDHKTFYLLMVAETRLLSTGYPMFGSRSRPLTSAEFSLRPWAKLYLPWAADYSMCGNRISSPNNGETTAGYGDGHAEVKWTAGVGETLELMVRRISDTQCIVVQCDQAGSTLKLIERDSGDNELASTAFTWTADAEFRIWAAYPDTDEVTIFIDDVRKITRVSSTKFTAANGVKVSGSSALSELRTWPWEVPVSGPFEQSAEFVIAITSPVNYQIIQRDGSNEADIAISGYWCGDGAYDIEARFNGGSWATIDVSVTGAFSGTLSNQSAGQGALEVRLIGTTHVGSAASVGIGDVLVIAGQSNAEGLGDVLHSYSHPTLMARMDRFTEDTKEFEEGWQDLRDPCNSSNDTRNYGTLWPIIVSSWMADQGVPVGVIPTAAGGTSISEWQKGGGDYYDDMLDCIQRATGGDSGQIKIVLWWQGEFDANAGMEKAAYNTHLDNLAADINSDFGVPIMPCILQNSTGINDVNEQKIRDATSEAMGDNANVISGPDFSDIDSDDSAHIKAEVKQQTCASRWWTSLEVWLDSL